uniref:Uncharacterized protein n=1 Tax=Vitis vinifera TaxID=29760 RepID=A5BNH6_VITVI|nr:hypothetical protein VITISV_032911 [Vitis vinifera]
MARIKGGHTDSSLSRNQRPRASFPQDSTSQAPEAPTIPSSEAKRVRTSGPGESSRPSQPDPRAPIDSQCPSGMSPEAIIKGPMVTTPPIDGN